MKEKKPWCDPSGRRRPRPQRHAAVMPVSKVMIKHVLRLDGSGRQPFEAWPRCWGGRGELGAKESGIFGADCPAARSADTTYKFTTLPHGLDTPDVKQVINYHNNYTTNLFLSAEMCHQLFIDSRQL